jgi:hypothetical protein
MTILTKTIILIGSVQSSHQPMDVAVRTFLANPKYNSGETRVETRI